MGINNQHIFKKMRNRKFAEDEVVVEEETTVTEETVEESPDSHDQFVSILVDLGLSAEQAEAVHTMAMDLIDAGEGEEITEEVSEEVKVEASRQRRNRRSRRAEFSRGRSQRPMRRELSATDKMEQRLNRLERSNRALRSQLREFGAAPATRGVRTAPTQLSESKVKPNLSAPTAAALEMINNYR
jgi:adenylate kinase family enzyme